VFLCVVIQVGDIVRLIDEPGQGSIVSISGTDAVVLLDGMELPYALSALVKVEFDGLVDAPKNNRTKTAEDKLKEIQARNRIRQVRPIREATYELDLHMHELLDRFDHMSKKEMLDHQLSCMRAFVSEAKQKGFKKIVLIHGVGEGILKAEIWAWLDQQSKLSYHDGPYRIYGYGATEIILWR
jgi:dsDNA-specific endonuclease/ATPase MutS2